MIFNSIKKRLTYKYHQKSGRNNQGIITVRHRGGGTKRRIRIIDNFRYFFNLESIVLQPKVYDPLRTAFVSLILYKNGIFSFILKPRFLESGNFITYMSRFFMRLGNSCPLRVIPEGVFLNSVDFNPGSKCKIARSAGSTVFIINKFSTLGNKVLLKLPSTEEYLLNANSIASIGRLDNIAHNTFFFTKAGQMRNKGKRPHVRGVAMNPIDHPHGGNTSIGRQPVSPWGKYAKGGKTRTKTISCKFIYKRRKKK